MNTQTFYNIDFKNINSRETLHNKLKKSLKFPEYYGMNLDAFWDCLTDIIDHGVVITLDNFDYIEEYDAQYAKKIHEIFERSKHYANDFFYDTYSVFIIRKGEKTELS